MQDFATISGLALGLTEVLKRAGLPSRYAPLASVILGVFVSGLVTSFTKENIIMGIVAALTASGLYSGAKSLGAEPV